MEGVGTDGWMEGGWSWMAGGAGAKAGWAGLEGGGKGGGLDKGGGGGGGGGGCWMDGQSWFWAGAGWRGWMEVEAAGWRRNWGLGMEARMEGRAGGLVNKWGWMQKRNWRGLDEGRGLWEGGLDGVA